LRVSAVSYLNTWPLVWGFLHGPQKGKFDFRFDLPSECARAVGSGEADIGLVPCAEVERLGLHFLPDVGIASDGPVRSIYLISKVPIPEIRTLAADSSSRTSVALARMILAERYGCRPELRSLPPELDAMLGACDAALIIGDPALQIEPSSLPWKVLDLAEEWIEWTGLPMVFAVWAGRKPCLTPEVREAFVDSWRWGSTHALEIAQKAAERGFSEQVAYDYVTRNIVYELGPRHLEGLELFRRKVRTLDAESGAIDAAAADGVVLEKPTCIAPQ
jgi:predicted solute-binding protein